MATMKSHDERWKEAERIMAQGPTLTAAERAANRTYPEAGGLDRDHRGQCSSARCAGARRCSAAAAAGRSMAGARPLHTAHAILPLWGEVPWGIADDGTGADSPTLE
jgi:hypothetical protein